LHVYSPGAAAAQCGPPLLPLLFVAAVAALPPPPLQFTD